MVSSAKPNPVLLTIVTTCSHTVQTVPAPAPLLCLHATFMTFIPSQWAQLLRLELHYEAAHEAIAADHGPYYYLSFIGTAPEARGRGLGSKLLQEITSRADREGRWCLLEATSEKSEVRLVVVVVGAWRGCHTTDTVEGGDVPNIT